jgi:hypothetical protein
MITKTIGKIVNGKYVGVESTPEDQARFAEMLQTRKAPDATTDREFLAGRHNLRDSYNGTDAQFRHLIKAAREKGYEPKNSDIYEPNLAYDIGDPLAFIPSADPKGHIKSVAKLRNQTVHGVVEHQRAIPDRDPMDNSRYVKKMKKAGRKLGD